MNFKINIPDEVSSILNTLEKNGYEAYIIGGCVRDSILGKRPSDWDITTNANPLKVKQFFSRTIDTGLQHGTVTVIINKMSIEVTTYRVEGKYKGNRRPESVTYASSLKEDVSRRDFTINSIAYHPKIGFIDYFDGLKDIEKACIRSVGEPVKRFEEDALRMLRAIRFSSQLGFDIDHDTLKAISQCNYLIKNISNERIRDELNKILLSENPLNLILLRSTGLLKYIIPELDLCFTINNNSWRMDNLGYHLLNSVNNIEKDLILRWTMLLHDIGKNAVINSDKSCVEPSPSYSEQSVNTARIILNRLRFDNKTIEKVLKLIKYHNKNIDPQEKLLRKTIADIGKDIFEDLLKVKKADILSQDRVLDEETLTDLEKIHEVFKSIIEKRQCLSLKELAVTGKDLLEAGIPEGKKIGSTLKMLLEVVIEKPELNNRDTLLEIIKNSPE